MTLVTTSVADAAAKAMSNSDAFDDDDGGSDSGESTITAEAPTADTVGLATVAEDETKALDGAAAGGSSVVDIDLGDVGAVGARADADAHAIMHLRFQPNDATNPKYSGAPWNRDPTCSIASDNTTHQWFNACMELMLRDIIADSKSVAPEEILAMTHANVKAFPRHKMYLWAVARALGMHWQAYQETSRDAMTQFTSRIRRSHGTVLGYSETPRRGRTRYMRMVGTDATVRSSSSDDDKLGQRSCSDDDDDDDASRQQAIRKAANAMRSSSSGGDDGSHSERFPDAVCV
jgi:hypothetical protein